MKTKFEEIGRAINEIRMQKRMSQMAVGLKAGYTNAYISRVELGNIRPTMKGAEDILNAMGYKISILIEPMEEEE